MHCKSLAAQETRALLTARKLVQSKLYDIEMSLRGILRGFGLKVGPTTPKRFARRIEELVSGHATLEVIAKALLAAHAALLREFDMFEKRVRSMARADKRARLMMSAPGVGAIVALTYVSAIDDPSRFSSSKRVGPHFGLTPRKYQSGETDVTGRITKIGDAGVRTALYEAANVILTRPVKGAALKSWAMKLARRAGMKKAKVALARKLAVVLHGMWGSQRGFAGGYRGHCASTVCGRESEPRSDLRLARSISAARELKIRTPFDSMRAGSSSAHRGRPSGEIPPPGTRQCRCG